MNNKYKLVALFGPAGSGKDYMLWHIMHTIWGKTHLHRSIPSTTRPPREGEIEGVNYHFISTPKEFLNWDNMHKWIDFSCFNNWWYGTSIDDLDINKINIGVFNIDGIKQILEDEEIDLLPIYIKATDKIRLLRQLNREDDPDCKEIIRRFTTDSKDFSNLQFSYHVVENNYDEAQPIVKEIIEIIRDKWNDADKMI